MAYIEVYKNWLPYAKTADPRGYISKRFGNGHSGVDSVNNNYDNPICAVMDGVVTNSYTSKTIGNVLEYTCGKIVVRHYHLKKFLVEVGDMVQAGETLIAVEGSTGLYSSGKHLHTSILINGTLVDPEPYLCGKIKLTEDLLMARKVIRDDLNMRTGPGVGNPVIGTIPVGTLINPVEAKTVNGATWGKHTCVMPDGREHTGWSNLGDTWSEKYTGAVAPASELAAAEAKISAAKDALK